MDDTHAWRCCHIRLGLKCAQAPTDEIEFFQSRVLQSLVLFTARSAVACWSRTTGHSTGDNMSVCVMRAAAALRRMTSLAVASPFANCSSLALLRRASIQLTIGSSATCETSDTTTGRQEWPLTRVRVADLVAVSSFTS